MRSFSTAAAAALLACNTFAAPLQKRATIPHTSVVGFPQTVPSGTLGQLYLKYQPYLEVVDGCVPFPAVDAAGNVSGGLAPTGGSNDMCSSSTGQVYARSGTYDGKFIIIYAWFMPKDEPSTGIGHRYDWEFSAVMLSSESLTASLVGVFASAHGKGSGETNAPLSGNHPLIEYYSPIWPIDHQTGFTTTVGGMQPLIAWESLTAAAQSTLNTFNFGDANVPFDDSNLASNLALVYNAIE